MNIKDNLQALNEQNHERFLQLYKDYKDPLKNTPIVEFSFQRFFVGGEHLSFFSHSDFSQYYFLHRNDLGEVISANVKNLKQNQIQFFLWPQNSLDPVFERVYSFGIYFGLTIYLRIGDYVNNYHFSGNPNYDVVNYYMNNMDFLVNFATYFEKQISHFIDLKDKKIYSQHTGPFILDSFNDHQNNKETITFYINNVPLSFTHQELKCYDLLASGYSTKSIANQLQLSPRTVEFYINKIKMKNGNISKDRLVEYYHTYIKPKRFFL